VPPINTSQQSPSYAAQVDEFLDAERYETVSYNLVWFNDQIVDQNKQIRELERRLWIDPLDPLHGIADFHSIQALIDKESSIDVIRIQVRHNKELMELASETYAQKNGRISSLSDVLRIVESPLPLLPSKIQQNLEDRLGTYEDRNPVLDMPETVLVDPVEEDIMPDPVDLDETDQVTELLEYVYYTELVDDIDHTNTMIWLQNNQIADLQKQLNISPIISLEEWTIIEKLLTGEVLQSLSLEEAKQQIYRAIEISETLITTMESNRSNIDLLNRAVIQKNTTLDIAETLNSWWYNEMIESINTANNTIKDLNNQIMELESKLWLTTWVIASEIDGQIIYTLSLLEEMQDVDTAKAELSRLKQSASKASEIVKQKIFRLQTLQQAWEVKNRLEDDLPDPSTPEYQTVEKPIFPEGALPFDLGDVRWISSWYQVKEKERKYDPHKGVDFSMRTGKPLYAVWDATIKHFGHDRFNWIHVILQHKWWFTSIYKHLSKVSDEIKNTWKWWAIDAGTKLWLSWSTGASTAPHLHLQLELNWTHVDPTKYIDFSWIKYKWTKNTYPKKPTEKPTYTVKEKISTQDMEEINFSNSMSTITVTQNWKLLKKWDAYQLVIWDDQWTWNQQEIKVYNETARTFALPFSATDVANGQIFSIFGTEWKISIQKSIDNEDMPHIEMVTLDEQMEGIAAYNDKLPSGSVSSPFLPQGTKVRITNDWVTVDAVVQAQGPYTTTRKTDVQKHNIDPAKTPYRMMDVSGDIATKLWMTHQWKPDGIAKVEVEVMN